MTTLNPTSFPGRMLPPLEELACQVLRLKQYHRLHLIAELLDLFSFGAWDRLEEENKEQFLTKLEGDFNIRAWDDWDWKDRDAYSRVASLIAAEIKGMKRKAG